jgi:hypothetical protein
MLFEVTTPSITRQILAPTNYRKLPLTNRSTTEREEHEETIQDPEDNCTHCKT